jgi:hypothetical protein
MKTFKLVLFIIGAGLLLGPHNLLNAQWTTHANGIYYSDYNKSVAIRSHPTLDHLLYLFCDTLAERTITLGAVNEFMTLDPKYGIHNSVSQGWGYQCGIYNEVDGSTASDNQRGIYNRVEGGQNFNYGIQNYLHSTGDSSGFGIHNYVHEGTWVDAFGIKTEMLLDITTGGTKYGYYALLKGDSSSTADGYYGLSSNITTAGTGPKYGVGSLIETYGKGINYGIYSRINSTNTDEKYGVYSEIQSPGDGNKFGIYSKVNTAGSGISYGVYSDCPDSNNWAGYFLGRGYFSEAVAIGTPLPDPYMLGVKGNVGIDGTLEADVISVVNVTLPDYVFNDHYNLRALEEVEKYINENHHLPDVPSAEEVRENGMDITEMNNALLQKVEELMLYMIDQNKAIDQLQKENAALKETIDTLLSE